MKKTKPRCADCGSEDIVVDVPMRWDYFKQCFAPTSAIDLCDATCEECGSTGSIDELTGGEE